MLSPTLESRLSTLHTTDLSYNATTDTFVAEASELGLSAICTVGYKILNPKTGVSQTFVFTKHDINDGDVMGWRYKSDAGINLLIIND